MLQQLTIKTYEQGGAQARPPIGHGGREADDRVGAAGRAACAWLYFERQSGMTSAEFERRLKSGELEEAEIALTDWRMEVGMLRLLEKQYEALQEARID